MIIVGINENVKLTTPAIHEQYGSLEMKVIRKAGEAAAPAEDAAPVDEFQSFLDGGTGEAPVSQYDEESYVSLRAISVENFGEVSPSDKIVNNIKNRMAELRHILAQGKQAETYNKVAKRDRAKFLIDTFKFPKLAAKYAELGITSVATRDEKVQDQAILDELNKALFSEFIEKFVEEEVHTFPLRYLGVRQSKNKHYPAMRQAKFEDSLINYPVFEREDLVPLEKSALAFTKWEKENGRDSGEKITADAAAVTTEGNALFD